MISKVLCDKDSWNKTIVEEGEHWVENFIKKLDLNMGIIYGENRNLAVRYLLDNEIAIESSQKNNSIKIFKGNNLIGEWKVDSIVLKRDKDDSFYNEIIINSWSVTDNNKKNKREKTKK